MAKLGRKVGTTVAWYISCNRREVSIVFYLGPRAHLESLGVFRAFIACHKSLGDIWSHKTSQSFCVLLFWKDKPSMIPWKHVKNQPLCFFKFFFCFFFYRDLFKKRAPDSGHSIDHLTAKVNIVVQINYKGHCHELPMLELVCSRAHGKFQSPSWFTRESRIFAGVSFLSTMALPSGHHFEFVDSTWKKVT